MLEFRHLKPGRPTVIADPNLAPLERHQLIFQDAVAWGHVRVKDLAAKLGVHEMTVRRDLDVLAAEGLLERFHGGARIAQKASEEASYTLRAGEHQDAKTAIAHAALELIRDGDTIALDASTTVLTLAGMLNARTVNTVITSLEAANVLAGAGQPFTLVGGEFHARARSFVGALATSMLRRLHPDKVFFSSKGFTLNAGFTDAHLPETEMKERLIQSGALVVALLHHSKFSRTALHTIAELEQVDVIITDREPNQDVQHALEHADVRLIVAEA
jgi:DeoR/GlpR family transcriptional regulator of sugar metabolism